jgi:protein O-GlcNAc transferase
MHDEVNRRVHELFATAALKHRNGQLPEAERLYRAILEIDPRHADTLHLLGVIALQVGRYPESARLIRQAIAENDAVPAFYNNLGNAERARGELQEAASCYEKAFALNPNAWDVLYNQGVVLQELGRFDEAIGVYERVVQARPDHAAALTNLGNLFNAAGRFEEALRCYERALKSRADFLPALVNRGNVLKAQGRQIEAIESYRRALALNPAYPEAHNNLGLALLAAGSIDEAIASFQSAIGSRSGYLEAHRNLGNAWRERGNPTEAIAGYRRALSLHANDAEARLGLAMAAIPVFADTLEQSAAAVPDFNGALAELADWSSQSLPKLGAVIGSTQPFYLAYRPADVTAALSRYGELVCGAAAAARATAPSDRALRERRRIAIVCGQVRSHHPVWEVLLKGIVTHLKRERLEVFLYHTESLVDDETAWARSRVDRFVQGPKSTMGWVGQILYDDPDIIFYPEIGMDPVTCALAAIRLAPLQVASWGHPVTTGLPTIDLFLSGALLESQRADAHYREKLIRLPGTGACTRAGDVVSEAWNGDERDGVVRFALPHTPIKFDPADDELFPKIAKSVGACEFWLVAPKKLGWATERLKARLGGAFRAMGLNPDQYLRVTPWMGRQQFMGFLEVMDVYLDCPAFSGYTTAWQALHAGIPLVTLEGEFLRQRLAAGLLRQIEMPGGIAQSQDDYVNLAVRFATATRDAGERGAVRGKIRAAAPKADDNEASIDALERVLLEASTACHH